MSLRQAYKHCGRITRKAAGNFYYAFCFLPKPKRQALHAIYAFCRVCDDIVDDEPDHSKADLQLNDWEDKTRQLARQSNGVADPILLALRDTCQRYDIPHNLLHEVIAGVRMDLSHQRYASFEELSQYCWKVASVVGLMVVHVLGFRDEQAARKLALYQGLAMQLTNILRDIREDASMGRIYLPQDELQRFDYSENELMQGVCNDAFERLMGFQVERIQNFYDQADYYQSTVEPETRYVTQALDAIYHAIFEKIKVQPDHVMRERLSLPWHKKARLACAARFSKKKEMSIPPAHDPEDVQLLLQRYVHTQDTSWCLDGRELPAFKALPGQFKKAYDQWSDQDVSDFTRWLSRHHYENFTVVSWFLPRDVRQHFFRLYSFCRMTDDLGDEPYAHATAFELLDAWENDLLSDKPAHPILRAVKQTINQFSIPMDLFTRLIEANRMDQCQQRHANLDSVLHYCEHSATPVGRMLLYVLEGVNEENLKLSDSICIGLQLANFWQDVSVDLEKGRIYIPLDDMQRFGVAEQQLLNGKDNQAFRDLMKFQVARARQYFVEGMPLADKLDKGAHDIRLFALGGMAILDAIEHSDYDVLRSRPTVTAWKKLLLMFKGVFNYGSTTQASR